jgi:hypothetical protein
LAIPSQQPSSKQAGEIHQACARRRSYVAVSIADCHLPWIQTIWFYYVKNLIVITLNKEI